MDSKGGLWSLTDYPPVVAPYHMRMDWMIWFLPFTVRVSGKRIYIRGMRLWFVRLMIKLLENDKTLLKLFRNNPFKKEPPTFIRARFYRYQFTRREDLRLTKNFWKREDMGEFCPELSLKDISE